MKTALKTAMMASISEVLETMFFLSLEFNDQTTLEDSGVLDADKPLACQIGFEGNFSGYFILLVPNKLLNYMTVSFMGMEEDELIDEYINGTIKETINMLAGSTFSNFDDTAEFQLNIPKIVDIDKAITLDKDQEEITVIVETTEGHLALKTVFST